ncbi:MAG: hypothetical protein EOP33_01210 [Rickettsiaceae bacterium]|nr:MAG: hypothetical protein EOP33_01210 [Rickettsiaceae bacterium]
MYIQGEQNLSWLQDFYKYKIQPLDLRLPKLITDEEITNPSTFPEKSLIPGFMIISTLDNPGWNFEFSYSDAVYGHNYLREIATFIHGEDGPLDYEPDWHIRYQDIWLFARKRLNTFAANTNPSYLNIILEAFKCWIEGQIFIVGNDLPSLLSLRSELAANNPLLTWLENFYLSCCDGDWEHSYGYRIVSTQTGWVAAFSVEDLQDLDDKPFEPVLVEELEGMVECYVK